MSIQPTYANLEQSKALQDKNFDEPCHAMYHSALNSSGKEEIIIVREFKDVHQNKFHGQICSAPEQWQVIEFLRINHGIWISVGIDETEGKITYYAVIHKIEKFKLFKKQPPIMGVGVKKEMFGFNSPQEAYSAAFSYVLSKLI